MNREPIGLYIFRYVLGFGLFAFMCMLYWSSALLENNVRNIKEDIATLRNELYTWKGEGEQLRADILNALVTQPRQRPAKADKGQGSASPKALAGVKMRGDIGGHSLRMDSQYPNLLEEDPFYITTLPKLLPPGFKPQGTFYDDTLGKPENLHPFSSWATVSAWTNQCIVSVGQSKFGIFESLAPDMAIKMEERLNARTGKPEFWVFLRDNVFWAPLEKRFFNNDFELSPFFQRKHKVTAHDFKFYYDAIMNPSIQDSGAVSLRNYFGDIEAIEVLDDLTFVVRWHTEDVVNADGSVTPKVKYSARLWTAALHPLPGFVYQYFADGTKIVDDDSDPDTYRTSTVFASNFSHHWAKNVIVSCGPWLFDGMSDQEIRFRRNKEFYQPLMALADTSVTLFKTSPDAIWLDFKATKTDSYIVAPEKLAEWETFKASDAYLAQVKNNLAIKNLEYLARRYTYIGWNQAKPYFSDRRVRQAMTMALDRRRIIDQFLNGLGVEITGTFSPTSSANDKSIKPWPYDPMEARRLLQQSGWHDLNGDGIIEKEINGEVVPFIFNLTYFVKSSQAKAIAEYVATALREVGVLANLNGVDVADLTKEFEEKGFDAMMLAWTYGAPPDDPRQLWHSQGAQEKGSSNAVGFSNAEADKIIDLLRFTYDREKRDALYHRFDAILHEEQPYTFLYAPKALMLYREYLQNVFVPAERQDLIPGADVPEPLSSAFWLKNAPQGR